MEQHLLTQPRDQVSCSSVSIRNWIFDIH